MAWKDNAVGVVIDKTMSADFGGLKAAGFSFVVIEAGLGFDASPALSEQIQKAKDAGLPVIAQWTPHAAYDDYTFDGLPAEQIMYAKKALANKTYAAYVTSVERYWTGFDVETGHEIRQATPAAIDKNASEFTNTFQKMLAPLGKPVLVRTNDAFVQKYCPNMASWVDKFGFYLADWRYRTRAADGAWSVYTIVPAHVFSNMTALRAAMPPDNSKNPLVPGNAPQLKFWEYTGAVTMPASLVKGWDGSTKKVKVVLFNGDEAACLEYLKYNQAPPTEPPGDDGDGEDGASVDLQPILDLLKQIADDVHAIRADIHDIRLKFS